MDSSLWRIVRGDDPVVATAIHDGHEVRREVGALLALSGSERLREEDPHTGRWTEIAATRIVPRRSRFEVDLNRPRERAVYLRPEDAWGLQVWKEEPSDGLVARSLATYDAFYSETRAILSELVEGFGTVVVLDLHSYNHRREGRDAPPADPTGNPEVNVGTGNLDRARFGHLVERFIEDLHRFDFAGRHLDARENVRFRGGNLSRWSRETFAGSVCAIAVEFKKFFMDEWSGEVQREIYDQIPRALASTLPGLREELKALRRP